MIKIIKIGDAILHNISKTEENIPTKLEEFKPLAIDTINWLTGQNIKKVVGEGVQLSTCNSKGIILITKLLSSSGIDTSSLSDLEKDNFEKMVSLGDSEYADSKLLNTSLSNINTHISEATKKILAITAAGSIAEIIEVLNSKWEVCD